MTDRQKQCLLSFLGYDTGGVDGIWGDKSRAATKAFQQAYGLTADGIFGDGTAAKIREVIASGEEPEKTPADWWKEIQYFTREEFRCPCGKCGGFPAEPEERLVRLADRVRGHFGVPVTVTSGVRCQAHNDSLSGSAKNSYHIRGKAMDFVIPGRSASEIVAYVKTQGVHYTYAINDNAVHMDVN